MIVCGKCGFTQPKDVYCANCGVNLEKYKPEKPPKLVQLLKDPYFQISSAVIVAIAAFFIFINKPSPPVANDDSYIPEVEVTEAANNELEQTNNKAAVEKPKAPSFKKQLNALTKTKPEKTKPKKTKSKKAEVTKLKTEAIVNDEDQNEEASAVDPVSKASFSFYEILPSQVEKYFTGSAKVQASVIKKSDWNLPNLSSSRLPIDRNWNLSESKSSQLDYMIESIDDGELQGIKFSFTQSSKSNGSAKNINIRVNANIPNKEGSGSSIDWSRSLDIEKDSLVVLKVKLPHNELSASFIEDNYNSPLSIMGSAQFLDQKTQLLAVISFE